MKAELQSSSRALAHGTAASILELAITPSGQPQLERIAADADLPTARVATRIGVAFEQGSGHGLLHLGAVELDTELPPSLAFGRELGHLFMTRLCAIPDLAAQWESAAPAAGIDELRDLADRMPPMIGAEYVTIDLLQAFWADMLGAARDEIPELLFLLRAVDPQELAAQTADLTHVMMPDAPAPDQRLEGVDLSALFGIEMDEARAIDALVPVAAKEASVHAQAAPKPDRERARKAAAAPKRIRTITTRALAERGIPYQRIQSWLKSGLLARTGTRGVYQLMKGAEREINASMSAA
jgi:hypothetical protein